MLTRLYAVNMILPAMGEKPVTSIESRNPTVQIVLNALDTACRELQGRGWYFNRYKVKLYPNQENQFVLPDKCIGWYDESGHGSVQRGGALFNPRTLSHDFPGVTSITGTVRLGMDFEEMPQAFQFYAVYKARDKAYKDDLGMDEVVQAWGMDLARAEAAMMAEEVRNLPIKSSWQTSMGQTLKRSKWR